MTVRLWPSMLNFCIPSAPALIKRRRWTLPGLNLKLVIPAFLEHFALSPGATLAQLKLFRPWIRLLSDEGPYLS